MSDDASDEPVETDSGVPDDYFETTFGRFARYGRFITMENTLSAEEHAAFLEAILAEEPVYREEQEAKRAALLEILRRSDSIELLAYLGTVYLFIDPDTYQESAEERSPAHVEYVALQALGLGLPVAEDANPDDQPMLAAQVIELVREIFEIEVQLIEIDGTRRLRDDPEDAAAEYRVLARLQSLAVRGDGYAEHTHRILRGCFEPLEAECRRHLGFTAADAVAIATAVGAITTERLRVRVLEQQQEKALMLRQLKHERRHKNAPDRQFPPEFMDLTPTEQKARINTAAMMFIFRSCREVAVVDPPILSERSGVELGACEAFLRAFACGVERYDATHHAYPTGAHPMTVHPALEAPGGYLFPTLMCSLDAIRPCMEELLKATPAWERYQKNRGTFLAEEATRILDAALPGARSWTEIKWDSPDDRSDVDGLVTADDLTLRLQCKAGELSEAARRGAPGGMRRDVGHLITDAAEQHRALDEALSTNDPRTIGFDEEQSAALERPLQLEVIVCLDRVSTWATQANGLRRIEALPEDRHIPWIVSLGDLMAVGDLLAGSHLIHYLLRRQRIERDGRVRAHDELDWVGHYIFEGLYFDPFFEGDNAPSHVWLSTYTEQLDAWYFTREGALTTGIEKPMQPVPPGLAALLARLERERPCHWILAAAALLEGDDVTRLKWHETILHVRDRVSEVGWSNGSIVYRNRLGVTLFVDMRTPGRKLEPVVVDYCIRKADELETPNWIAVAEGARDGLFVDIAQLAADARLHEVLVNPHLDFAVAESAE